MHVVVTQESQKSTTYQVHVSQCLDRSNGVTPSTNGIDESNKFLSLHPGVDVSQVRLRSEEDLESRAFKKLIFHVTC